MKMTCEDVLATVQWAHHAMYSQGFDSGLAFDVGGTRSSRKSQEQSPTSSATKRLRGEAGKPPSKHARYLRGDTVPRHEYVRDVAILESTGSTYGIFHHPVFDVLRDAVRGTTAEGHWLGTLAPRLHCAVLEPLVDQSWLSIKPITHRLLNSLAIQADGYALAALLAIALEFAGSDDNDLALLVAERAFQCMIFSFAGGEFSRIYTTLSVRTRQLLLDKIQCDGLALDTATLDIHEAIVAVQNAMKQSGINSESSPVRKRAFFRQLLTAQPADIFRVITPTRVQLDVAKAHRISYRKSIEMDSVPEGQLKQTRRFGKIARRVLQEALKEYW